MAVHYLIQAEVVDIKQDLPKAGDAFLVDTNVWYWMMYNRAQQADRPPLGYQTTDYPAYLSKAITASSRLHRCELALAELAHLIERTELEIFAKASGFDKSKKKEFRHNYPIERANVVARIQSAWGQIKAVATPVAIQIDEATADAALTRLQSQFLDGYDLFMLEAMAKAGVVQVITDDGDFTSVAGIQVFTSNAKVIQAAQNQGKLVIR